MTRQTLKLQQLNNDLDFLVSKENQIPFTDMICYLRNANISEHDQEVVRHDLLDMILSAQKRGESIQAVIGDDYKGFCDSIIASLPPRSRKEKLIEWTNIVSWSLSILFAINLLIADDTILLIKNLLTGKSLDFRIAVSLGNLITIGMVLIAAVAIVKYITKNAFRVNKMSPDLKIKAFCFGAGFTALLFLIVWVGKRTLFSIDFFAALLLILILYGIHKMLERL